MFSNLIYGRFFHHYLTLSAVGQGGTLFDKQILDSVIAGLRWNDLLFSSHTLVCCYYQKHV